MIAAVLVAGSVQQRPVAALLDVEGDIEHQAGAEPLPAVLLVHRDGADSSGPAVRVQALPGHRDQSSRPTDAHVATQLMGAGEEGARAGASDQGEHVDAVRRPQLDDLLVGRRGEAKQATSRMQGATYC